MLRPLVENVVVDSSTDGGGDGDPFDAKGLASQEPTRGAQSVYLVAETA